jgi:hypothetical protein
MIVVGAPAAASIPAGHQPGVLRPQPGDVLTQRRQFVQTDQRPASTVEVMVDARLLEVSPYPTSRVGATGFIGYSPSAGKMIVGIACRGLDGDLHGINAWPASGRDLAAYLKEGDDGEEP